MLWQQVSTLKAFTDGHHRAQAGGGRVAPAEPVVRESERKYLELVEHANSIILRWGRDGRVIFLNEFGQRFFGYTEAEICGRHVVGTIVPETGTDGRSLHTVDGRDLRESGGV